MNSRFLASLAAIAALAFSASTSAQLTIRDDLGRALILKKPATRVVTLAPFLTEILFAAGAGDLAVGVDNLSDYPPQAFSVPKVPTGAGLSLERLATLKPDLVLAYRDGIRKEDIERIAATGTTVFVASAHQLDDVPRLMRAVGTLTARDPVRAIAEFEARIAKLRRDNAGKFKVTTFVEIWNRPLTTVSGEHFLTEALDICRAENVFSELKGVAPKVSLPELEEKNPYVIVGAGSASSVGEFRSNWVKRQSLGAVKGERLLFIPDETIARPTPRTPEGIAKLCAELDNVRDGKVQRQVELPAGAPGPGIALKPSGLGAFVPSLSSPVSPPLPAAPTGANVPATAAPAPNAAPPAVPAGDPPPKRPSQYGD
ncbi:MAG TPA: helical backbone metal receptor [Usitatibacter sp.]|nr:helical backbone metal receptor [Usitatibacter sp.]